MATGQPLEGTYQAADIQTIPDTVLVEIFERIPFDHLHSTISSVCRRWHHIITDHFRYPRALLIRGSDKMVRIQSLTTTCSRRVSVLKISDAFDAPVIACLKEHRWPQLRTLIVQSSWTNFDRACISVADLNHLIDSSPKLRSLKICECLVNGNLETLFERIEARKIRKLSLLNRYLVVNNADRLYDLQHMEVFRVYNHLFDVKDTSATLDRFIANNQHSLTDLALYAQTECQLPGRDDVILRKVASSCSHLAKLTLAGRLRMSSQSLIQITDTLPRLRKLKMDVSSSLPSAIVSQFLRHKCVQKLDRLKVSWHRRAQLSELESLRLCSRHLTELALEFWEDDYEFLAKATETLTKLTSRLGRLKFLFTDIGCLSIIASLTSDCGDLGCVKFVFAVTRVVAGSEYIEAYVKTIELSKFRYEYSFCETEFTITLTRRTRTLPI